MKVKVINLPVFYDGNRYEKDDELTIDKKYFVSDLFSEQKVTKKAGTSKED
ncbi:MULTISPECIES: hypothetical protein [Enterococcus]|uniref:hypothetical protein n=1 Tax=Enterococcus TaxID=1350 RepID=UPI000B64BFA0|nr:MULTISPECIES: hypothetical protein [unclassified Enterococcus]OTO77277.1 hypothetical protein A5865_001152 [Enterococcus sp. 12E11_DIV0728]OUZ16562.1 hypothetical protein A5868_001484 [Enterococcus sp. 12F9_DIV0723]DAI90172.1 MAG TPA: hypothetical protein [Caudoviricetes sp.]